MSIDYCLTEAEKAIVRAEKGDPLVNRATEIQLAASYAILAFVQTLREQGNG